MTTQKVLFVTGSQAKSGGTERACANVVNALAACGKFQLTVLSATAGRQSFFDVNPSVVLDEIYAAPRSLQLFAIDFIWKLRSYLRSNPHEIIVVVETFLAAFVLPAAAGLKTNVIAWEHFGAQVTLGAPVRRLARRMAARHCAHVVVLTNADRELWLRKYRIGRNQISRIYNINPMHDEAGENASVGQNKVVLTVGRLVHEKGYDLLLNAWAKVCLEVRHGWKLRIIGDGDQKAELEALKHELGVSAEVDLVPKKANVVDEYRAAGIFALSSRFEGFGLVLVEAMTFGLPIVSFDCPWGPREILQDRSAGVLVPHLDVAAFARQLEKLMASPEGRSKLGARGKSTLKRYDPYIIGDEWHKLLRANIRQDHEHQLD